MNEPGTESLALVRGARVLVADDMAANFELVEAILDIKGITTDWAATGREALTKLQTNHYDLLLLDMHMPDIDGPDVIRRLRAEPGAHIPKIVVATADTWMASSSEMVLIGADGVFTKPIDIAALLTVVEDLLASVETADS